MNVPTLSTHWWEHAPLLISETSAPGQRAGHARYRIGDVVLEVDSTYAPLLDELESAYADCSVTDAASANRVICSAQTVGQLVAMRFDIPASVPHLCAIASAVTRHRADLQHFVIRPRAEPEWQYLANLQDENEPLLVSDSRTALFNPRVEPPEFLVNFIVAVVQFAQDTTIFVHGGGASIAGHGTLLVGRSGQGKSTTSIAVAARGHPLLGDETIGIRFASRELLPFRRTLKLRPGPRSAFIEAQLAARRYGTRPDAKGVECAWVRSTDMFLGVPSPSAVPFTDVFFLRQFSDAAAIEPFAPRIPDDLETLQPLTMSLSAIASWPLSPAHRALRFARIADVFSRCNCYFLDLGTPDETAELIERTVLDNAQRA